MGGLQMLKLKDIHNFLMINTMRRFINNLQDTQTTFYSTLLDQQFQQKTMINFNEMLQHCGPNTISMMRNRFIHCCPTLYNILGGMAALLRLNEQGEGWATAHIAGHTGTPLVQTLTAGEAITLSSYGLKTVADLFPPHELRPGLNKNADIIYPSLLQQNYPGLVARCKNLRSKLAHRTGHIQNTQMTFFEIVKDLKLSKLYRSLKLQQEDSLWPGPPSFFTRRKDGYSLPPLHVYMAGYKTCMSLDMPSKTKEVTFNTLNRQIWTNQKGHLMANNRGEEFSSKCALCDKTENTMHLLFECEKYSELLWFHMSLLLQQQFNKNNIVIHAYNVMYCVTNMSVPQTHRLDL